LTKTTKTERILNMDTQLNNYQVLRNGKSISPAMTLEKCVQAVRILEQKIDRVLHHSPYTIGRVDHNS